MTLVQGEGPSRHRQASARTIERYLAQEIRTGRSRLANASRRGPLGDPERRAEARYQLYTARLQREVLTALTAGELSESEVYGAVKRLVEGYAPGAEET